MLRRRQLCYALGSTVSITGGPLEGSTVMISQVVEVAGDVGVGAGTVVVTADVVGALVVD